jgi:hypothetical protein
MWKTRVFFDITRAPADTTDLILRYPHEPAFDHPDRSHIMIGKACYRATDGGHQPCRFPFPIKDGSIESHIHLPLQVTSHTLQQDTWNLIYPT